MPDVSLHSGAGEGKNATKAVGNALLPIVTSGLLLAAVYLLFAEPLLKAFGGTVNRETFQLSKEYFFFISLGIPFYMFGQAMNPIIRSDGSPRFAMISLLAGALVQLYSGSALHLCVPVGHDRSGLELRSSDRFFRPFSPLSIFSE